MKRRVAFILKYLSMSVFAGILYIIICYFKDGKTDIIAALRTSAMLFITLCILAAIAPKLRKVLGFKDDLSEG